MNPKLVLTTLFLVLWGLLASVFNVWDGAPSSMVLLVITTLPFAGYVTLLMVLYRLELIEENQQTTVVVG